MRPYMERLQLIPVDADLIMKKPWTNLNFFLISKLLMLKLMLKFILKAQDFA